MNIPIIGFGTWDLRGKEGQEAIKFALKTGYRHIDTADYYGNHIEVGKAIKNSGIKREEIYLVTKIMPPNLGRDDVLSSVDRFLVEFNTDYIDLLLIHWPGSTPVKETLEAMADAQEKGLVKHLGVSNFEIHHLKEAFETGVTIINNQIDYHPTETPDELVEFCKENDLTVTAYSPLGEGRDLNIKRVQELAIKYDKTPAQVILKWLLQKGFIVIPRSANKDHIKENFEVVNWDLEEKIEL